MKFRGEMPKKLCALALVLVPLLACERVAQTKRALIAAQARERLMQQIEESRAFDARLRDRQGATSAEVLRAVGNPARTSPCDVPVRNCFYYDVAGQTQFICFDEHDRAVCRGRVFKTTAGRYR